MRDIGKLILEGRIFVLRTLPCPPNIHYAPWDPVVYKYTSETYRNTECDVDYHYILFNVVRITEAAARVAASFHESFPINMLM